MYFVTLSILFMVDNLGHQSVQKLLNECEIWVNTLSWNSRAIPWTDLGPRGKCHADNRWLFHPIGKFWLNLSQRYIFLPITANFSSIFRVLNTICRYKYITTVYGFIFSCCFFRMFLYKHIVQTDWLDLRNDSLWIVFTSLPRKCTGRWVMERKRPMLARIGRTWDWRLAGIFVPKLPPFDRGD